MTLEPAGDKTDAYRFSACLGSSSRAGASSPLGPFTFTFSVHFPGTVDRKLVGLGTIDHAGETVSWKNDLAALRGGPIAVGATVVPGRASEQRYWLILMLTLTVLVGVIMLGILRRGAKESKQGPQQPTTT
jgi:hypothetical protein